ncbi:ATP-dependent protease Lon, partial [mine drainage metagenome]
DARRGVVVATGKLGEIAKEAVQNVSALIKKYTGEDISRYDIHIQFVGTSDGVEGDSASVSIATAVISALEGVAVDQSVAMTGSLSVRGQVLPVGGVTAKVEAAADSGLRRVLIPESNMEDLVLEPRYRGKIEVIPVRTLRDVLKYALAGTGAKKDSLLERLAAMVLATARSGEDAPPVLTAPKPPSAVARPVRERFVPRPRAPAGAPATRCRRSRPRRTRRRTRRRSSTVPATSSITA